MSKNIKNDKSDSFIFNFSGTGNENAYYMAQIVFSTEQYMLDWDVDQKGYYLVLVNVKYDLETRKPHSPNFLFSDVILLVPCNRRGELSFNKALNMVEEVAKERIGIMENDKDILRQMGVNDDEINNMIEKIRKEMEEEKKESDDTGMMLVPKPVEKNENKDKKKITFDDVAGMEEVKEVLLDVIDQFNNPKKYEYFDIPPIKSLLMYGRPGTGKTFIANAFANEIDAKFVKVSLGEIGSKYQNQTGNNIKKIFDDARKEDGNVILLLDEVDSIAVKRGNESNDKEKNNTLNVLLTEMSDERNDNIFIICCTNFFELLDPAFCRSGRIDVKIEVPLPNYETRLQILELNTRKKPLGEDINLGTIAKKMDGKNCADVSLLCNQSARIALKKDKMEINQEDFLEALNKMNNNKKEEKVKKIGFESQNKVEIND